MLLLGGVLCWKATEAAQMLGTTVAAVNSALQRARATLETSGMRSTDSGAAMDDAQRGLLARYLEAFEAYDIEDLTSLIKEDATQSISPHDLSLRRRRDQSWPAARDRGQPWTPKGRGR